MKYLLMLSFCALSVCCSAQILKYKATELIVLKYQNQDVDPPYRKDGNNAAIDFDMDSSVLNIHSTTEQVFHLTAIPTTYQEGDTLITTNFNGIDKDQIKCYVRAVLYKLNSAAHAASFTIEYPDKMYMYYVQIRK